MDNARYTRTAFKGWNVIIHKDARPEVVPKILSNNGGLLRDKSAFSLVKSTPKSEVFLASFRCCDRNSRVYLKHFPMYFSLRYIFYLVCTGRAKRALRASLMLEDYGFNTPKTLFLMERKYWMFCTESILITEEVSDAVQLDEKLQQFSSGGSWDFIRKKRRLIREFGMVVGEMHQKGVLHGDLRLRNVLVQEENRGYVFWLIDNERTKLFSRLRPRHVRKNLVQMNMKLEASNADRLRFIKAYSNQRGISKEEIKVIIQQVSTGVWRRQVIKKMKKVLRTSLLKIKGDN